MSAQIILAFNQDNKVVHISDVARGKSCNCTCLECGERLIAAKGNIRDDHFKHFVNSECKGGTESDLHILVKQILAESDSIVLKKYGAINYKNAITEKRIGTYYSDVEAILDDGEAVYFEVFHTHRNTERKDYYYNKSKLKSVEINMDKCPLDNYESIKDFVLNQVQNKRVIFWEEEEKVSSTKQDSITNWSKYVIAAFLGALALILLFLPDIRRRLERFY